MWQNDKTPEAPGRLENLKELVTGLEQFENLQGFLEHVSLIMDNERDDDGEMVTIMTMHAAKGLEFPAVFLPGWEEGFLPSQRSMDERPAPEYGTGAKVKVMDAKYGIAGLQLGVDSGKGTDAVGAAESPLIVKLA
jgi:superfamily I DNA/RNA helicase